MHHHHWYPVFKSGGRIECAYNAAHGRSTILEGKDQLPARRDVGKPCGIGHTILAILDTVIDPFVLKLILSIRHRALGTALAVELDEDCYYAAKFPRSEQTTKRASLNHYVCHWWSPLAFVPPSVVCYSPCSLGARISPFRDPHISSARFQTNEAHVALSASCRYEGHRLQQLGLQEAATGLMLDACRATSLCNAEGCNGIDDLTYGGQGEGETLKPLFDFGEPLLSVFLWFSYAW